VSHPHLKVKNFNPNDAVSHLSAVCLNFRGLINNLARIISHEGLQQINTSSEWLREAPHKFPEIKHESAEKKTDIYLQWGMDLYGFIKNSYFSHRVYGETRRTDEKTAHPAYRKLPQ
jgi:hypothetical protein